MRFGHGELHLVLLAVLAQRSMHGYELMNELSRRIGRRYRASPGSIYPAIQALESEGLLVARLEGDRRIFEVTDEGRAALDRRSGRLAAVEQRLGVHFSTGVDASLQRFAERVRAVAHRVDAEAVESILDRTATEIESTANGTRRA
jgi:DNA-binding PadR family transcriptional regulator